jgi:hypothetical protein
MSQTAYTQEPERAFQGMLADSKEADIITRAFEGAGGSPFGVAFEEGTTPAEQVAPTTLTGFNFVGVGAHRHNRDTFTQALDIGIDDEDAVNVLRKGRIWVPIEQAVVPHTSAVFIRHTVNGGLDQLGAFRIDADTARADDHSAVAEWLDSITIAGLPHTFVGLGLLSLNLPGA